MDVRIAAHVAQLTHIDPAPQAKSQRVAAALGQIDFGLNREDFETPPQLDHQTTRARVQYEGPVYVTSAFAQVLDMGMSALDFERLSFSVGKHQRCRDGLAGFVIQDAPFQPVQAQAPVSQQKKSPEHGDHHQSSNRILRHGWAELNSLAKPATFPNVISRASLLRPWLEGLETRRLSPDRRGMKPNPIGNRSKFCIAADGIGQ